MANTEEKSATPEDLAKLGAAVNASASQVATLWLSFLTFMAYLTLTVGSVTHAMLFKESPIRLPVLTIDLPLVAFFWIAPILFLLFHFYLFLQTSVAVRKASSYSERIRRSSITENEKERLRSELNGFLVIQFLFGDREERHGATSLFLRFIALVTLVWAPIIILMQFQLMFLPYHLSAVTWMHRLIVCFDFVLIWYFWSSIRYRKGNPWVPSWSMFWPGNVYQRILFAFRERTAAMVSSFVVLFFSISVFAFPGEIVSLRIPHLCNNEPLSSCFLRGRIDMVRGTPQTFFSNVLVVPNNNSLIGAESLKALDARYEDRLATISMRGRDLVGAVLIRSDLRGIDFTGANLNEARLDYAKLTRADFSCAFPPDTPGSGNEECTRLQGASFYNAHLEEARFQGAKMQGALLAAAILHGAEFFKAQLQMADFSLAQLQGAGFNYAILHGATFVGANMIGATLDGAELQEADLSTAHLELASLSHAVLDRTKVGLAGPSRKPLLPSLMFATLPADNRTCSTSELKKWKNVRDEMLGRMPEEYPRFRLRTADDKSEESLTFEKWKQNRESAIKEEKAWMDVLNASLMAQSKLQAKNKENGDTYASSETSPIASYILTLVCASGSNPYITRALIRNSRIGAAGADFGKVWLTLRDPKNCEGAAGLQLADYQALNYVSMSAPAEATITSSGESTPVGAQSRMEPACSIKPQTERTAASALYVPK